MKCKICNQNETDDTNGICWKCVWTQNKPMVEYPLKKGDIVEIPILKQSACKLEALIKTFKE